MDNELLSKSVEELSPLIKEKSISPIEITKSVLAYAEAKNDQVNAYISFSSKEAELSAAKAEAEILKGHYRGMYHGIPIAIKDNIYIKNQKTTIGSKIHQEFYPSYDANVIQKLKEAGAIFLGKLNMHEYAWGITNNNPHYGPCRNPWNLEKIAGGSSGGSGASVAADMAYASLGTDTGGSIRIPASACGIVGLKPTYGRVSNYGSFPLAPTLDHIGPMTKTVKDAAGLLELIVKDNSVEAFVDQLTEEVKGLVIGIHEEFFFTNIDPAIDKIVRNCIQTLVDRGAKIKEVDIPSINSARWAQSVILRSEFAHIHQENRIKRETDYGEDIRQQFKEELPSVIEYLEALKVRKQLQRESKSLFSNVDIIIAPTLSILPPDIGDEETYFNGEKVSVFDSILRLTGFANTTGLPAISIPCGFKENMPVGLQIIGPYFGEQKVLNTAYALEKQYSELFRKRPKITS